ncbi:hypothetical protein B0H13DRAFT_1546052, partial [Mycena leptocephala]
IFYYHRDPHATPLEGSLRFRVTADKDTAAFHDLLLPSGCPWQIILPQLACRSNYSRILNELLEQKLVT